ncbi:C4-dicarboxylate transporter DctA [Herbaspirillum sp. WKF16]|jgi:aerobic C4-dicarboxylate transport protein|uniref:C4-dicarboxylate transporter DctA n=1 Tax=Herbaspirillum sp. WKF16 TaxID=3028312 RepID=UPI0023A9839E|nr:C4-dicarboxylate transporter DctA [Herbaspirillum sp. WKF16]WDZ97267.1 C4-dicarboxylate transporter DctA [Herbaspirillum sp. WKF16]
MKDLPVPRQKTRKPFYRDISFQVLVGIVLGVVVGHYWPNIGTASQPLGDAFIRLIQMVVGPVIFCSVVSGIANAGDMKKVGRVAIKALIYFEVVTSIALVIGLVTINVLQPGVGMNIDVNALDKGAANSYITQASHFVSTSTFLLNLIPKTMVSGFANGDILQILFVSVLFGFGLAAAGERAKPMLNVLESFAQGVYWIIGLAMKISPIAAYGAIAFTVSKFGVGSLVSLGKLVGEFYLTCLLFFVLVLWPVAHFSGFSLLKLMRYIRSELLLVLGTSSSESVFPQLLRKLEQLGCEKSVVGLVLPGGYSFNHDGTCLYFAAVSVFLAQATNTALGWEQQLALLLVLLITSKGGAGVAGSAIAVLAATLASTNAIPVSSIAVVLGVHRLLSSAFVFVNITGNALATVVVARWENALDRDRLKTELDAGYVEPEVAIKSVAAHH